VSGFFDDMPPEEKATIAKTGIIAGAVSFVALIGVIGWLAFSDKDVTTVLVTLGAFVMNALGVLLYGRVSQVKDLANGQITRLADMIDRKTVSHNTKQLEAMMDRSAPSQRTDYP
jgi:hypothetical protein